MGDWDPRAGRRAIAGDEETLLVSRRGCAAFRHDALIRHEDVKGRGVFGLPFDSGHVPAAERYVLFPLRRDRVSERRWV